jgi:taurine dioxygenase
VDSTDLFAWRRLDPFGVEIDHDLSEPLSPARSAELVRLLWEHGLLLARGQTLDMARQQALCALFGPVLIRTGENGYLTTEPGIAATLSELRWHADAAYTDAPFDALSLHAIDVVADASSTCFVDTAAALSSLPADLRARIADAEVEMISPHYTAIGTRACDDPDPVATKRSVMPAIHRNPHNGRDGLWVSELQTARVTGMERAGGRDLLHALFDHLYRPEHVLEHRWRTGDLVIWDNIALQHMRGPLKDCGTRILQRVIVGSEGAMSHAVPDVAMA